MSCISLKSVASKAMFAQEGAKRFGRHDSVGNGWCVIPKNGNVAESIVRWKTENATAQGFVTGVFIHTKKIDRTGIGLGIFLIGPKVLLVSTSSGLRTSI